MSYTTGTVKTGKVVVNVGSETLTQLTDVHQTEKIPIKTTFNLNVKVTKLQTLEKTNHLGVLKLKSNSSTGLNCGEKGSHHHQPY